MVVGRLVLEQAEAVLPRIPRWSAPGTVPRLWTTSEGLKVAAMAVCT